MFKLVKVWSNYFLIFLNFENFWSKFGQTRMVENKVERNSEQKRIKEVVINVKKMDWGPQFH